LKEAVSALKDYQVVLSRISTLDKELSHVPSEIKVLETEWQTLTSQIEKYKSEQEELEQKCHKADVSLGLEEEKSQKFERDLTEVTNDKEYNAVLREIDTAKKETARYKELIKTNRTTIKETESKIEECAALAEESKSKFDKELKAFRSSQAEFSKELIKLNKDAKKIIGKVPKG